MYMAFTVGGGGGGGGRGAQGGWMADAQFLPVQSCCAPAWAGNVIDLVFGVMAVRGVCFCTSSTEPVR